LVIPASAVLQTGTRAIAFVDHGNGNLEPRTIEIGPQLDDSVVVLSGLKAGEKVVSSANFLVDSEAQLQAAMQEPLRPRAAAVRQLSARRANRSRRQYEPSPPQLKGANTVRVKLTSSDGKPVPGAQVTATFFMPAMPAMGMAAERDAAALSDKGNGLYEGSLQLDGWHVAGNVTVQRGGQTLGTKQLSLSAVREACDDFTDHRVVRAQSLPGFHGGHSAGRRGLLVHAARAARRTARHQRRAGHHSHAMGGRAAECD
jgi:hypothetical protein